MSQTRGPITDGRKWDDYVGRAEAQGRVPGEEWGRPEWWDDLFKTLLSEVDPLRFAVEIGQGSGKYTQRVLDAYEGSRILCCDVSQRFLASCLANLPFYRGRIQTALLGDGADDFERSIKMAFLEEPVDMVFSIDALVHVDQQMFANYLGTAHRVLRPGGVFSATLASLDDLRGATHLRGDIANYYANPDFAGRMVYYSASGLERLCELFGFTPELLRVSGRDILLRAVKN